MAIGRNPAVLSSPERLYLDHAATTPMLPEARAAVAAAMEGWANPSSPHADGRRVRAAFEEARRSIADELGWRHDVILTSGASEAVQIVAARAKAERRIVNPTEHDVVIAAMGEGAAVLPVDKAGLVDLPALEQELAARPALVAVQLVNNETGVIQPIDRIQQMVRDAGSLLLADCAQAAGKSPLPDADFVAVSAHKFGGPPGVGALLVKDLSTLRPSGGQERGYRRGTENWPAVAGMAAALATQAFADAMPRLESLRQALEREIVDAGGVVIAAGTPRIATIGSYAMPGVGSASQLV
ncbi:MAG TPA: aminotransferase class V-fold PLP-dependent enzyme, partial [Sphingomicrobium sp.]|nr:aminotransferase class V-fold PLP-dependent enzyme [Sphingomicrobium sp.]